jgi:hypothetical protein
VRPQDTTDVRALGLAVVDRALTARLLLDLGRPCAARAEVERTLTALAAYDAALAATVARLPIDPPDPLPAPAGNGPL